MVRLRLAGIVAVGGEVGFAIPPICCSDAIDAKPFQPSKTGATNGTCLVSNAICGHDTAVINHAGAERGSAQVAAAEDANVFDWFRFEPAHKLAGGNAHGGRGASQALRPMRDVAVVARAAIR
jgi:hypothetical protein